MILIGDVHGLVDSYWKLMQKHNTEQSIQVGDFGFAKHHRWHLFNMDSARHKILFGNHDDTNFLKAYHSLRDFHYDETMRLFTIRGAYSIDRYHRIEGRDWWPNEELNYSEWQSAINNYESRKPEIMITHDCPHEVREAMFGITDKSITSDGLQACFEIHQPRLWVFGHHHQSKRETINGTQFICLAELETLSI